MKDVKGFARRWCKGVTAVVATGLMIFGWFGYGGAAIAVSQSDMQLVAMQPIVAYNIDFGMDLARVDQTIEYYGEEMRGVVEQALRNNVNHPNSKDTAENSYQRQTALNELLPERRSSAFSKEELTNLKKIEHPRERLR